MEEEAAAAADAPEKPHVLSPPASPLEGTGEKETPEAEDETELRRLLLPNPLYLPLTPPSAVAANFVLYFAADFMKPGQDQYIYRHANGLCVIGLAPAHIALKEEGGITAVDFNVGKSDRSERKVTGKRKRNAQHFEPNSALCKVCTNDTFYIVRCCVKGSLLEVNDRLIKQPELLNTSSTCERKWVKKVQKEWSILEKNLPDAIYVRVFEDRMDLLRAVIVGACGTPYQDGLFFFDFELSPEYPQVPPTAYYHSGGLRINPNLYEDGKVCLSLLNTWTGKANEVWDPASSSILQVLVSLQGLVLNSRPYFNEAGYEKQVGTVEGEKNSLPYNENTFLLNLRSMLYLLRRPPMHFEEFVKDHFQGRGHFILKACDAYMKGSLVGSLTKDACMTDKSMEHPCSVGFKLMLAKIVPKLFTALSEIRIDCREFEHLQKS